MIFWIVFWLIKIIDRPIRESKLTIRVDKSDKMKGDIWFILPIKIGYSNQVQV